MHSKGGGDTLVLTLRYAASEVGTSAERHILHIFSHSKSGTLMVNKESLTVTADNKSNPMSDPSREGPNDRKGENTTANRPRTHLGA